VPETLLRIERAATHAGRARAPALPVFTGAKKERAASQTARSVLRLDLELIPPFALLYLEVGPLDFRLSLIFAQTQILQRAPKAVAVC